MLQMIRTWLGHALRSDTVFSKQFAALIGSLNFLRAQIPRASLYLRGLHSALARAVRQTGWLGSYPLSHRTVSELLFWFRMIRCNSPYCFVPRTSQAMLTTDASDEGWSAHFVAGPREWHPFGFYYCSDGLSSSNQRETAAVLRGLLYFKPVIQAYMMNAITIRSDNAVTVYNLQRQGSGVALLHLTRAVFSLLEELDVRIHVRHIPGVENNLTDALSRLERTGDYELRRDIFCHAVMTLQINPTIDLFAAAHNAKCPRFAALPGPLSEGAAFVDAFSLPSWTLGVPYIFPPTQLFGRVLQRLIHEEVDVLLVVPKWTDQPWWGLFSSWTRQRRC
jgi:hypothetical protein